MELFNVLILYPIIHARLSSLPYYSHIDGTHAINNMDSFVNLQPVKMFLHFLLSELMD